MTRKVLAVDLGGSHATCAVVETARPASRICARERFSFPRPLLGDVLPQIERILHNLIKIEGLNHSNCAGIGMGMPGIVDPVRNRILSTNEKFSDGVDFDFNAWCTHAFGLPLRLDNDARMALQGEREAGAATGYEDVVMMTLGTGIGGAAVLGGRALTSRRGQAGILGGHLPIRVGGRKCTCGNVGCAESEASTWALPIVCREWKGFSTSSLHQERILDFTVLFRHADAGDPVAQEVLAYSIQVWATLAVALIHAYDPEILLIGGAVMARVDHILPIIQNHVAACAWTHQSPVIVAGAALGEDAALFGALGLLRAGIEDKH